MKQVRSTLRHLFRQLVVWGCYRGADGLEWIGLKFDDRRRSEEPGEEPGLWVPVSVNGHEYTPSAKEQT